MAAHPIVTVDDELHEKLPEEFKADPRYQKGASLELVPVATPTGLSPAEIKGRWDDFIKLRGIFADEPGDGNAMLEEERISELEQEARWSK